MVSPGVPLAWKVLRTSSLARGGAGRHHRSPPRPIHKTTQCPHPPPDIFHVFFDSLFDPLNQKVSVVIPGGKALREREGVSDASVGDRHVAIEAVLRAILPPNKHLNWNANHKLTLAIGRPFATSVRQTPTSRVVIPNPHRDVFPIDSYIVSVALSFNYRFVSRDWHFWGAGFFSQNSGGTSSPDESPKGHERSA